MAETFVRAPSIRAFDRGETTTVLARDGSAREFLGDSALLVRELLRALVSPLTMDGIVSHFDVVASGAAESRPAIEQAVRILREVGALTTVAVTKAPAGPEHRGRLVLGISGAVAAAHAPALVERLLRRGFEVRVAMTAAARRFVRPEPLRALTHHRVYRSLWSARAGAPAPHIELADWAEVVLLAPTTATTVSRLARGDCSDVVSALALTTRAPVVLAPSMNVAMHDAPAIARNLAQVVEDGFHVLHSSVGVEVADAPGQRRPTFGAWPAVEDIAAAVEHVWQHRQRPGGGQAANDAATSWEAMYRETAAARIPFHSEELDDDLRAVLERVKRPATLWDLGTGLGTVAREAARLGFVATGTDVSATAVAAATERTFPGATYLVDDVRQSHLGGVFDVVVDRGCFHTLDPVGVKAYVEAVVRRTHPGSLLVLKVHREDEPGNWNTVRYRLPQLEKLFAPQFELTSWSASSFSGSHMPEPRAWLAVFERRAVAGGYTTADSDRR